MTSETFRALALSLPRVQELAILGSQEFRIKDKVFATLGWPEAGWAIVRLAPTDQMSFMKVNNALTPEPGSRGRRGVTRVRLKGTDETLLKSLLEAAWRNAGGTWTAI